MRVAVREIYQPSLECFAEEEDVLVLRSVNLAQYGRRPPLDGFSKALAADPRADEARRNRAFAEHCLVRLRAYGLPDLLVFEVGEWLSRQARSLAAAAPSLDPLIAELEATLFETKARGGDVKLACLESCLAFFLNRSAAMELLTAAQRAIDAHLEKLREMAR